MTTIHLQQLGSSLASRARGRELRLQLEAAESLSTLDFTGVLSVSESFADEVLGVLAEVHGIDWLSEPIRVVILDVIERGTLTTSPIAV